MSTTTVFSYLTLHQLEKAKETTTTKIQGTDPLRTHWL